MRFKWVHDEVAIIRSFSFSFSFFLSFFLSLFLLLSNVLGCILGLLCKKRVGSLFLFTLL